MQVNYERIIDSLGDVSNYIARCHEYVVDNEFPDSDVTGYIKLIKQSGIVLYGRGIEETFADVSDEDFWESISAEVEDYDFHNYKPRYIASNILILGRILPFSATKNLQVNRWKRAKTVVS